MFKQHVALLSSLVVSTLVAFSCASSAPTSPGTTNPNPTGTIPAGTYATLPIANTQGTSSTISAAFAASGAKVAAFQWAGATCSTCQTIASGFESTMSAAISNRQVAHFMVFDDQRGEYQDSDYASFLSRSAQLATRVHDYGSGQKALLKSQAGRSLYDAVRPVIIIDSSLRTTLIWTENANDVVSAVNSALQGVR
jgi:hypothetical protein